MRKCYLLTSFVVLLFCKAQSQDTANFTFTIGTYNQVSFTNTSHLHGDAYRKAFWSFGDGSQFMTTPLGNAYHEYSNAGSYEVCLKIYKYITNTNDSALAAEECKTLTIANTTPDSCRATFTASFSNTALTELFIAQTWNNHEKKPEEICWNFGDNQDTCIKYDPAVSNNYTVNHHYAQAGQYNVCVKIRYQAGCVSDFCHSVVVGDQCKSDFTIQNATVSPLLKYFIAQPWSAQQKKPLKICWDFGDGTTECKQYLTTYNDPYSMSHTYTKAGQYQVCVSILYDGGCESKKCKSITVENTQTDSCYVNVFEVATNSNNLERHFYVGLMPNHAAERICWNFGDGSDTCVSLTNPVAQQSLLIMHHYLAPGVYRICVKVKYSNACESEKCRELVIRSSTDVCGGYMTDSLINGRTFAFRGYGIQNSNDHVENWRWTFGDGGFANDQQVIHTFAAAGTYPVCLYIKTDLGCETKICRNLIVQGENHPNLQLTPNPVMNTLHAAFISTLQETVTIHIYNANGILIRTYTRVAYVGNNTLEFDVSGLSTGIYSVVISSPHQLANAIFFKE